MQVAPSASTYAPAPGDLVSQTPAGSAHLFTDPYQASYQDPQQDPTGAFADSSPGGSGDSGSQAQPDPYADTALASTSLFGPTDHTPSGTLAQMVQAHTKPLLVTAENAAGLGIDLAHTKPLTVSNDPAAGFASDFLGEELQGAQAKEQSQSQAPSQTANGAGDKPSSDWVRNLGPSEVDAQTAQWVEAFANPATLPSSQGIQLASAPIGTVGDAGYFDGSGTYMEPAQLIWADGTTSALAQSNQGEPMLADTEVRETAQLMLPEDLRRFELESRNRNEPIEPTTGSALADEAIERAAGTVLGVAGILHGGVQFASDQVWAIGNAVTGGWLANNVPAAQAATARNIELGNSLLNLPGQISRGALRAVTGNWHGAAQSASNALQLNQIQAANARGDYLSAQVMTTQSAINVAGLAMGGVGAARAGLGMAAVQNVRSGAQLAVQDAAANLSVPRQLNSQFGGVRIGNAAGAGETVTVFRVQGGTPPLASRQLIAIDESGNPVISRTTLNISIGDPAHAEYFLSKRPGANVTSFDVPPWMGNFIDEQAIPQAGYRTNPANQGGLAPKVVDPTTPGRSYELPDIWAKWLEEVAVPGSGKVKKGGTP